MDDYHAHLRRRLVQCQVPEHFHEGLVQYVADRRLVGGFLKAVLSNDLRDACARVDVEHRGALFSLVLFLNNYVTAECWGSREQVAAWLADPQPIRPVFE